MDCGNVMLAALNFSSIHFFKLKYYGTFTFISQIVHSHLKTLKLFSVTFTHNGENLKLLFIFILILKKCGRGRFLTFLMSAQDRAEVLDG